MSVPWVPLGEVLQSSRHEVAIDPAAEYRKVGLRGFGRGLFEYESMQGQDLGRLRFFELSPDRVVVSNIKAWEGAVATTTAGEKGRIVSNRFLQYESTTASLRYVAHWLLSAGGLQALRAASPGSADRNRTLSADRFESIVIPLPPRPEQDRIAAHLDALADGDKSTWFPDAAQLLQVGSVGESVSVGDLVSPVVRSTQVSPDQVYPLSGVKWYGQGLFVRERKSGREISSSTVREIREGDLVYNRLFAWKQSFALAAADGFASNEFPTFEINADRVRPRVLLAALLSPLFTETVNHVSTGSTPTSRNRLKENDFLGLTVVVPNARHQPSIERSLLIADRIREVRARRDNIAGALLPAARNEIFASMV